MSILVPHSHHRTLKLHEWLALLALLFLCNGVHATTVYKCTDADGGVAYQSTACASSQRASEIELAPVKPAAPSPQYALDPARAMPARPRSLRGAHAKTEMANECHASNGSVFYRLGKCPHSVAEKTDDHRGKTTSHAVSVSSRPVTRAMACSEMGRAGAAGRKGHEYDEPVSTYDRNLGNDPCK
jgi:hypothetical protein